MFRVEVSVGGQVLGIGEGRSQKSAEIAAAEVALPGLRETTPA
jgi:dsRNA-specific ribonuclease